MHQALLMVSFVTTLQGWAYKQRGEQKLRDFRPPYLTTQKIIREYLHLGKFARLNSTNQK